MQLPRSAEHDPVAIAETALNLGITYFDTAPSYNNANPKPTTVMCWPATEGGLPGDQDRRSHARRYVTQHRAKLKRLQTDRVDLIQIHGSLHGGSRCLGETHWCADRALQTPRPKGHTFHWLNRPRQRYAPAGGHRALPFDTLLTTLNPVSRRKPFRRICCRWRTGSRWAHRMKVMAGATAA